MIASFAVQWQKQREGPGRSLKSLKAEMARESNPHWTFSYRVMELQAARMWGKTPSEWDALDKKDREQMLALKTTEQAMTAWESHYQSQELKKRHVKAAKGLRPRRGH